MAGIGRSDPLGSYGARARSHWSDERLCPTQRRHCAQLGQNQVLVSFGDAETNRRVIEAVRRDGTCWCGGTVWKGKSAMRISASSWATTRDDVEQSLAAIIRLAREQGA